MKKEQKCYKMPLKALLLNKVEVKNFKKNFKVMMYFVILHWFVWVITFNELVIDDSAYPKQIFNKILPSTCFVLFYLLQNTTFNYSWLYLCQKTQPWSASQILQNAKISAYPNNLKANQIWVNLRKREIGRKPYS